MFNEGDVVVLKSGSPYMTVSVVILPNGMNNFKENHYKCMWFVDDKPVEHIFSGSVLSKK